MSDSGSSLILVVDGDFEGKFLVCAVLRRDGFQVDSATSPYEVMARMAARMPDLILMDLELPGQDGVGVARRIKADPRMASVPIIALTAQTTEDFGDRAQWAGCSGYITKPIHTPTLGEKVRGFLAMQQ